MIKKLKAFRSAPPRGRKPARKPAPNPRPSLPSSRQQPCRMPGWTQADLAEAREAFYEFELTKGDWSKGR
jgi:hypothetical protein